MRLDIPTVEYSLVTQSTFDPATDFSDDPVIRRLQERVLAESERFVARMTIGRGDLRHIVWEVETNDRDPMAAILADIEVQAASQGVRFRDLVSALAAELRLEEGQAIVLALELTFPPLLAWANLRFADTRARGRGKPRQLDRLTNTVRLLGEGWERATGQPLGIADRAFFVRALDVAKDFLPLRRRGNDAPIENMLKFLRTEARKIRANDVRLVMPLNPLNELRPSARSTN